MFNLPVNTKEVFVYTYSHAAIEATGRVALARIVFADGSFLSVLYQKFENGELKWRPPYMQLQQNGHVENFPTMGGTLMDEAVNVARTAQLRIKKQFPSTPVGTTFRVTREGVEVIPNPKEEPLAQ